jgi:hypothetical protein
MNCTRIEDTEAESDDDLIVIEPTESTEVVAEAPPSSVVKRPLEVTEEDVPSKKRRIDDDSDSVEIVDDEVEVIELD